MMSRVYNVLALVIVVNVYAFHDDHGLVFTKKLEQYTSYVRPDHGSLFQYEP